MPIREENRRRYPPNWRDIRNAIVIRSKFCCEWCGKPNRQAVKVRPDGAWRSCGSPVEHVPDPHLPERWSTVQADPDDWKVSRNVRVVLTIAHLDHVPEHCEPANLRALCQQCHNRYDAHARARGRRARSSLPDER